MPPSGQLEAFLASAERGRSTPESCPSPETRRASLDRVPASGNSVFMGVGAMISSPPTQVA
jgi:hypothetical protein